MPKTPTKAEIIARLVSCGQSELSLRLPESSGVAFCRVMITPYYKDAHRSLANSFLIKVFDTCIRSCCCQIPFCRGTQPKTKKTNYAWQHTRQQQVGFSTLGPSTSSKCCSLASRKRQKANKNRTKTIQFVPVFFLILFNFIYLFIFLETLSYLHF